MSQQRSILAFFSRAPAKPKRPMGDDEDDFEQPAQKRAVVADGEDKKKAVPAPATAEVNKASKKAVSEGGDDDAFAERSSRKAKAKAGAADGVEPAADAQPKKSKKGKDDESSKSKKKEKEADGDGQSEKKKEDKEQSGDTTPRKKEKEKEEDAKEKSPGKGKSKEKEKEKKEGKKQTGDTTPRKKKKEKAGEGEEASPGKSKEKEKGEEGSAKKTPKKKKQQQPSPAKEGGEGGEEKAKADETPKKKKPKKAKEEGKKEEKKKEKKKEKKEEKKEEAKKEEESMSKKKKTKASPEKGSAKKAEVPQKSSAMLVEDSDGEEAKAKKGSAVSSTPTKSSSPVPALAAASPELLTPSPAPKPPPAAPLSSPAAPARGQSADDIEEVDAPPSTGGGGGDTESDEDLKRYRPLPPKPAPPTPNKTAAPAAAPSSASASAPASAQISVGAKKAFFRGGQFGGHSVSPPNRGKKAVPQGNEHCLYGLTFAFTGVLDSLEREEAAMLVEQYGGKVMKSAGKTLQFLVAGLEAGESKLRKAAEAGTKVIDEDGLFDMIRTRPGVRLTKAQLAKLPKRADPTDVAPAVAIAASSPPRHAPLASPPAKPTPSLHSPSPSLTSPSLASPAASTVRPAAKAAAASGHVETQLWVDKYAPQKSEDVVGNGAAVSRLEAWLRNWKPAAGVKRAALLTGPPGIGKSSSAHIVAHKLKYRPLETNASDARSRAALLALASATTSTSLHKFFGSKEQAAVGDVPDERRVVLIMDEVDGMSGTADRGGMKELISVIDRTGVPIICIANDARHPKIRSLSNHCEEIKYKRPGLPDVERRAIAVAKAEGIPDAEFPRVRSLVAQANGDMRQALNALQTAYPPSRPGRAARYSESTARKDVMETNVFELVPAMFRYPEAASMDERIDAYFMDDMLVPLMVWECYPSAPRANSTTLRELAAAANAASESDVMNRVVRRDQLYTLSPALAVLSTVRPCFEVRGGGVAPRFPALLGKMSATNKRYRLLKELQAHMSRQVSANKLEVGLDYLRVLHSALTQPLVEREVEGVGAVLEVMEEYGLTREDWSTVGELVEWPGSAMPAIATQAKTQLTLQYKKRSDLKHGVSRARATKAPNVLFEVDGEEDDEGGEPGADDEPNNDDDDNAVFANDKFVKRVVAKPKKAAAKRKKTGE